MRSSISFQDVRRCAVVRPRRGGRGVVGEERGVHRCGVFLVGCEPSEMACDDDGGRGKKKETDSVPAVFFWPIISNGSFHGMDKNPLPDR